MRCIDADALYEQLQKNEELARKRVLDTESCLPYPNNLNPSYTRYVAQMDERTRLKHMVADAPTIEPELTWHECFDDDPASFPDDERNVLVSFSNFSLSIIGQWRVDEDGSGCWYLGDTDETFLSEGLFVDGWWELPKKPRRN
jgi:hypothetical protein